METSFRSKVSLGSLLVALVMVSACTPIAAETLSPEAAPTALMPPTTTAVAPPATSTIPPFSTTTTAAVTETTLTLLDPPTFDSVSGINTIQEFTGYMSRGLTRWQQSVPGVEDIRVTSTADGAEQPVLWLAPKSDGLNRPLLVILHSWSSIYDQHAGIPYAMWALENGWAVIAPQFRGVNNHVDAIGSELAVQDVVDAIDYAISQDGVDPDRVYAVGYSGGGMMALLLAGQHPEKVTAVAAWSPPYDLAEFYRQSGGQHYASDLWRACGGNPTVPGPAKRECRRRSPMSYLDAAREAGVPVFIGQGISDTILSPSHGANAFNHLADPADRLTDEELAKIAQRRIPEHLSGPITIETFFGEGDPTPVFARHSGAVWLVFFQANHEMAYQATLRWFASDPR